MSIKFKGIDIEKKKTTFSMILSIEIFLIQMILK